MKIARCQFFQTDHFVPRYVLGDFQSEHFPIFSAFSSFEETA